MTIQDYLKRNPVDRDGSAMTYRKVNHRCVNGKISARKVKGKWLIDDVPAPSHVQAPNPRGGGSLKDALTAMQIKKIQQQLETGRMAIRQEAVEEALRTVAECLAPFREELGRLRLGKADLNRLRGSLDKAMDGIGGIGPEGKDG